MAILWRWPNVNYDNAITDLNAANTTTDSFKIKEKITVQTGNNERRNVKIMVPLKKNFFFFKKKSNFWRSLEISVMN